MTEALVPLTRLRGEIESAHSIDAALASKSHIAEVSARVRADLVARINAGVDAGDAKPRARPIATVSLRRLAPKPVLSSEADLEALMAALKQELGRALAEGKDVHLE